MIGVNFDQPFLEQLEFFRSKGYTLSPESWRDVWQEAHARAFTVARVTEADILVDIREALDRAQETGQTLTAFKAGIRETLEKKGWFAPTGERAIIKLPDGTTRKRLKAWRLDTIFSTNLDSAYHSGRFKQQEEVKDFFPYRQYLTAEDPAVRPAHRAMHGKVFKTDDPIWKTWYPPNGFRCRCDTRLLSEKQAKRKGLDVDTKPPKIQGEAVTPDEGFEYHPGEAGLAAWKPELGKYPAKIKSMIKGALKNAR
jgi:SPP1 gp7 family putative phage head morphogenesis protein